MLFVSYPNLIAIVPPDITSFVGWNERNKVGVRDGGGEKRFFSITCCATGITDSITLKARGRANHNLKSYL